MPDRGGAPPRAPERDAPLGVPLAWALSRLLPGREETDLLRAILHRGPAAHEAWAAFRSRIRDVPALFRTDSGGRKRLSPLLLASVRDNGLTADAGLLTVLRTAWLREELRTGIYRGIARECFDALRDRDIPFLVLKGAALAETAYAEPTLRHAHDIDLLVPPGRLDEAGAALAGLGLEGPKRLPWDQGIEYRHATELPILLATRLFRMPFYRGAFDTAWPRRVERDSADLGPIAVQDPMDALLHALGHASYCPGRSNLLWAVDGWMILAADPEPDWAEGVRRAQDMRLELPLYVMLAYLRDRLGAPVPESALEALGGTLETHGLRRDLALFGARQARPAHPDLTRLRHPSLADRATLLRWELAPSREYLAWAYHEPPAWALPALYLTRPFSSLAERTKWWVLRRIRSLRGG